MKKINLFILILLLFGEITAKAQDIIIKTDKSEIKSKVLEITDAVIKYKKFELQDGPVYNINKIDVFMIIYKNGNKEYITSTPPTQPVVTAPEKPNRQPITTSRAVSTHKAFSYAGEIEALYPLGSFGDAASVGFGIGIKGFYNMPNTNGFITATIDANYFLPKSSGDGGSSVKYTGLPFKVGYLATFPNKFFIEPQLGLYYLNATADGISAGNTNFLFGGHIGINLSKDDNQAIKHIAVGIYHISASDGGSFSIAGLSYTMTF